MLPQDQASYDPNEVARCLIEGGVVVLPTDTVYGIAALPTQVASVERLYRMKRRPPSKPLPIMIAAKEDLVVLGVAISSAAQRLLDSAFVPGPLTLAMGFVDGPQASWLKGREEIAIRIPKDDLLLAVLRKTGPLFVTSANAHGISTPETLQDVLSQLDGAPDLTIDGGILGTVASTLVNCRLVPPVVEREGVVSSVEIQDLLQGA